MRLVESQVKQWLIFISKDSLDKYMRRYSNYAQIWCSLMLRVNVRVRDNHNQCTSKTTITGLVEGMLANPIHIKETESDKETCMDDPKTNISRVGGQVTIQPSPEASNMTTNLSTSSRLTRAPSNTPPILKMNKEGSTERITNQGIILTLKRIGRRVIRMIWKIRSQGLETLFKRYEMTDTLENGVKAVKKKGNQHLKF